MNKDRRQLNEYPFDGVFYEYKDKKITEKKGEEINFSSPKIYIAIRKISPHLKQ